MTRVLICDDAEDIRFLLRMQLGIEDDVELVGEANNGAEAVRMARDLGPDIVLMDLAMPVMDGFEALGQIVSESPTSRVVILSALNAETTARQALDQGASAYIQKGAPAKEILGVIRRLGNDSVHGHKASVLTVDIPFEPTDLIEAKDRFTRLFEDSPIGMALARTNGHFARVNRIFTEIVGREERDLVGMSFRDITHPDDIAAQAKRMQSMLQGHANGAQVEKRYLRADGSVAWGVLSMSLIRNSHDEPVCFIGQLVDISERKRMEGERDRFIMRTAHEIRTPLAALSGYASLLSDTDGLTEDQISRFVEATERQGRRINRLLDNLLDLTLSNRPDRLRVMEQIDLLESVNEVIASFTLGPDTVVKVDVPSGLLVRGESVSVHRVLVNLVSNALKYGGDTVWIHGRRIGDRLAIEVMDEGAGIEPEVAAVMFEPFERGPDVQNIEGSGLGLAVCRGLARAMGGELTFRANTPSGAIFSLLLNPA
jgi:PAS domain S-box-containing protein